MTTDRRFAHFKREVAAPRIKEIPEGGFCISAFVIISKKDNPNQILMGHLNKKAAWDHIGGLDAERVERHSNGWMLPSSGLIFGESPQEAAQRILKEQLGLENQKLEEPLIVSEVYGEKKHWDIEFMFVGEHGEVPLHEAWTELKFIDLLKVRREEIARMHEDVLAHVEKWKQ